MALSFIRAAKDELSCPVCYQLFVDPNTPKTLPGCGHVCCEICLKTMIASKSTRICPECRNVIRLQDASAGVQSFPTNFRLRNLAERHQKVGDDEESSSSGHGKKQGGKSGEVSICPAHGQEKMHYYCITCNMLACQACLILKHNDGGHKIEGVKEIVGKQQTQLVPILSNKYQEIKQAEFEIQRLTTLENQIQCSQAVVGEKIEEAVSLHINEILSQGEDLKRKLQQAGENKITDLRQKKTRIKQEVHSVKISCRDVRRKLESLPDNVYVTQHSSLVDDINKLSVEKHKFRINITPDAAARFVPCEPCINLGNIIPFTAPNKQTQLDLVLTLDGGFDFVENTACSSNGLLAVCDRNGMKVVIYQNQCGKIVKKLTLDLAASSNQHFPQDVAICPNGMFLVARYTGIEVFTASGNYQQTFITAEHGTVVDVYSVAVTADGRIFAGDIERSIITELHPTGYIIKSFKTNTRPVYTCLIRDTHIAMSDYMDKVSVMDIATGQETLSINTRKVFGICYDKQTNCLLAVKKEPSGVVPGRVLVNTGVIAQYSCSTGRIVARLVHELYNPIGLTLTLERKVIVADENKLKIYQLE